MAGRAGRAWVAPAAHAWVGEGGRSKEGVPNVPVWDR